MNSRRTEGIQSKFAKKDKDGSEFAKEILNSRNREWIQSEFAKEIGNTNWIRERVSESLVISRKIMNWKWIHIQFEKIIQCESFIMESQMTRFVLPNFRLSMRTVLIHRNGYWVASNKFLIGQSETKSDFKKRKVQPRTCFGASTLSSSINEIGREQIESFGFLW